jgi:hypothetical protein
MTKMAKFGAKLLERFKLGFTISDPMSNRGKEILEDDWNAGYDIINAVLESEQRTKVKDKVLVERISLANKEYDLIQA